MKIYTKTGDCGTTGLFAGPRVDKDHPRIQAYGAIDELNAILGVVAAQLELLPPHTKPDMPAPTSGELGDLIRQIQSDLFAIGAELATPAPAAHDMCLLAADRVAYLEQCIDRLEGELAPLRNFVLPGGSLESAQLHWARTVCRRAERDVVQLARLPDVHDCSLIMVYLNRLSDLLFVLARTVCSLSGLPESPWLRPSSSRNH
jgi:cob(I)alamin adenosyltransferase